MNAFSLEGQVALVTGANTGIGQAIAVAMAQAGANVIAAGRRDCDETLALIGDAGQGGAGEQEVGTRIHREAPPRPWCPPGRISREFWTT